MSSGHHEKNRVSKLRAAIVMFTLIFFVVALTMEFDSDFFKEHSARIFVEGGEVGQVLCLLIVHFPVGHLIGIVGRLCSLPSTHCHCHYS